MRNIVTVFVEVLIGLDVAGLEVQVVQSDYLKQRIASPKWRKLREVSESNGLITWKWKQTMSCTDKGFSAATKSSKPTIQMYVEDFNKILLEQAGEA